MIHDEKVRETIPTDKRVAMALESIAVDIRELRSIGEVLLSDTVAHAKVRAEERAAREAEEQKRADAEKAPESNQAPAVG